MAYTLPDFNLLFDWWDFTHTPSAVGPDQTDLAGQLYRNSRGADTNTPRAQLRVPTSVGTGLANPPTSGGANNPIVECPQGSGCFYRVERAEYIHRGFPNEYVALDVTPCQDTGARIDSDTDLQ